MRSALGRCRAPRLQTEGTLFEPGRSQDPSASFVDCAALLRSQARVRWADGARAWAVLLVVDKSAACTARRALDGLHVLDYAYRSGLACPRVISTQTPEIVEPVRS